MEIFYVTGNKGKFEEAKEILPQIRMLPLDLEEIQSLDTKQIVRRKAEEAYKASRADNLVVDDVSLYLEALDYKLPGPFIKWFLASVGSTGIYNIAKRSGKYGVIAVCTLCYRTKNGKMKIFEGRVKGIAVKPKANSFKSWDGVFMPSGSNVTFADMDMDHKNAISHRGIAVSKLKRYLIS